MVPLAVLLPDEEVRRHTARGDMTSECALLTQVDKNITLPVEPKVNYLLLQICTCTFYMHNVYNTCTRV